MRRPRPHTSDQQSPASDHQTETDAVPLAMARASLADSSLTSPSNELGNVTFDVASDDAPFCPHDPDDSSLDTVGVYDGRDSSSDRSSAHGHAPSGRMYVEDNEDLFAPSFADGPAGNCPLVRSASQSPLSTEGSSIVNDRIELSIDEKAMLDLMMLCDASCGYRGLYDDIIALLRKHGKKGFNPIKAKRRNHFVAEMRKKVRIPDPVTVSVRGQAVIRFPFLESLQDLLDSHRFNDLNNLCVNREEHLRFSKFIPNQQDSSDKLEIMSREWASSTYDGLNDFNPETDFPIFLVIYGDKTGTDKMQRCPLEPWMFTLALLRRHVRECSDAWRHIGFLPPLEERAEDGDEDDDMDEILDSNEHCSTKAQEKLQLYHDYMSALLADVKHYQRNKPRVWLNLGGVKQLRKVHLEVAVVMGDQKSQDCLCGRMSSNNGAAGRVHRSCMCSASRASDTASVSCQELVNPDILRELNLSALTSETLVTDAITASFPHNTQRKQRKLMVDFVKRKVSLARSLR